MQPETLDELIEVMAAHFEEYEEDYRSEDWCEVVHEDEDAVVIADHKGYEITEWGNEVDDYGVVSAYMHRRARELCDYDWSVSYPVVFERRDD